MHLCQNKHTHTHANTGVYWYPASDAVLFISNDMAVTIEEIEHYHTVNPACGQVKHGIWCTMGIIAPAVLCLQTCKHINQ